MADIKPRIRAPQSPKKGEIVEIKTLVQHEMESGQRKDAQGKIIPRKIINTVTAKYNGKDVFQGKLEPAMSAPLYIAFSMRVDDSGTLEMSWVDDDGSVYKAEQKITVAG